MPRRPGSATLARRVGARIRELRAQTTLTQEQLAWACDLHKAYLSQVESGKRLPSLPAVFALARELGVEVADVVALDPKNPRLRVLDATRSLDAEALERVLGEIEARVRA